MQRGKGEIHARESRASRKEGDSSLHARESPSGAPEKHVDALRGLTPLKIHTLEPRPALAPATELHPLRYGYALVVRNGVVPPMPIDPPPLPEHHSGTFYVVFIGSRVGIFHDWYAFSIVFSEFL